MLSPRQSMLEVRHSGLKQVTFILSPTHCDQNPEENLWSSLVGALALALGTGASVHSLSGKGLGLGRQTPQDLLAGGCTLYEVHGGIVLAQAGSSVQARADGNFQCLQP